MKDSHFFLLGALIFLSAVIVGYFFPDPLFTLPPVDFGLESYHIPNPYVHLKEVSILGCVIMTFAFIEVKRSEKRRSKKE